MVTTLAVAVTWPLVVTALALAVTRPLVITAMAITLARFMPVMTVAMLSRSMPAIAVASIAIVVVLPVVAMTVISQRAEREPGDQRRDDAMIVVGVSRGARRRQRKQAGHGHHLQFVYVLLNH